MCLHVAIFNTNVIIFNRVELTAIFNTKVMIFNSVESTLRLSPLKPELNIFKEKTC